MAPVNPVFVVTESGPAKLDPTSVTSELIGWKAFGLSCLPQEWVPAYLVVTASCLQNVADSQTLTWVEQVLRDLQVSTEPPLFVRSSGTAETLKHRGRLHSQSCKLGELLTTIRELVARSAKSVEGQLHLIVQEAIAAVSKGHLSNERRVSYEGRDWLATVEFSDERSESAARIAVRTWRDGILPAQRDLRCNSEAEVTLCLKRVAMWATQYASRSHFEWVWNGRSISIVQTDKEEPPSGTRPRDLLPDHVPSIQVAALRVFRPATETDYRAYKKLANARLYGELGYLMPQFYVLDDERVVQDLFGGVVAPDLEHDLRELTRRPLVIRTDGINIPREQYEMLPRTEDTRSAAKAVTWLTQSFAKTIEDAGLRTASLCLIAHHFIPSVAAAWARAEPSARMVRIESLWGLPEGLYWYAHDTFEVDTGDTRVEPDREKAIQRYKLRERLRFKGTFIAPDEAGNWIPHQTRRPHDWGRSVSKRAWLFEIAHTTRQIAERQQHAVAVMWFIDNHPEAIPHKVLPWFHVKSELLGSPNPAPRNKRHGATNFVLETKEKWDELQQLTEHGGRIERVVVQPSDPELIRNPSFAKALAKLAAAKNFVIVLSGGILAHVYYVLLGEGAQVECVDLYGVDEEVIEFNKLVRDRIPELIQQGGERVDTIKLRGDALILALRRKLVEEAFEALDSPAGGDLIGELADVLEVIRSLAKHLHVTPAELRLERVEKHKRRGGFREGLMLKTTATQHSLQAAQRDQHLPGIEVAPEHRGPEIITAEKDLPRAEFYRRPDQRQLDQSTVEKLLTFETSIAELPSAQPLNQRFSFSVPGAQGGEREVAMSIELQRERSALRCVIRVRLDGTTAARSKDDSQLQLDFEGSQ